MNKISLVTLAVTDFDRSLAFYRDGLGLRPYRFVEGVAHVTFEMAGTWLSLFPRDQLAADASVQHEGSGFSGITLSHNVADESQVYAAFAQALCSGARAVKTPQRAAWGGFHAYFADPDGHLWEVAFNPYTDLS